MSAAAIVAGNPVVYKPSRATPVVGHTLAEIFAEAGLPPGVFNYVPGRSGVMGDLLVDDPRIGVIAFTGSMEVGLRIVERAGRTPPGQPAVKKVIAEMGGKNAVIVDDDADLDEAVPAVVRSAFGYQGQKCSACSRVIVLDALYNRFLDRLLDCARSVRIGPAENPAFFMGPVIDRAAQERVLEYIGLARQECRIAFQSQVPDSKGFYVPLTVATDVPPDHRLAQEEIFGPVLAVLRARDFTQALGWANATRFALTGGLFSRTPSHIARCRREFRVGNLYVNRGITGAIVGRQPFGGFRMSGVGSKAGGPDYLLQFLDPRVVTENTMRRGFVPFEELRSE
jgi:RHH-type proline utilization regulon transcriptional repressor/proline dehydrogenase/delta 1-pyrroline-5-carboxylate dehydrogenase